jgi:hypothetical protein
MRAAMQNFIVEYNCRWKINAKGGVRKSTTNNSAKALLQGIMSPSFITHEKDE